MPWVALCSETRYVHVPMISTILWEPILFHDDPSSILLSRLPVTSSLHVTPPKSRLHLLYLSPWRQKLPWSSGAVSLLGLEVEEKKEYMFRLRMPYLFLELYQSVKKGKKKLNYQLSLELAYIPLDHSVVNIYIFIFIRIYLYWPIKNNWLFKEFYF